MNITAWVIVQGIGCTQTGARAVLIDLLKSAPAKKNIVAICPKDVAVELIGKQFGTFQKKVFLLGLSHRIFGRLLRVPLELMLAVLLRVGIFKRIINLSNYGFCFGGSYLLYFHSQPLLDKNFKRGWSDGKPNFIKDWMLMSCIFFCRAIFVQTYSAKDELMQYCARKSIAAPLVKVLLPRPNSIKEKKKERVFSFQLFYPVSTFPHKRADLAMASVVTTAENNSEVGLVITSNVNDYQEFNGNEHILQLGSLQKQETEAWYAASDALLFTSERETLGLPLLEAIQYGLPVIVPNLRYAKEILGEAGCYFSEFTKESVSAAIENCIRDYPQWRLSIAERREILNKIMTSWENHWGFFLSM